VQRRVSSLPSGAKRSRRSFLGGAAAVAALPSGLVTPHAEPVASKVRLTGVNTLRTVGSIAAGSKELTVASASGFSVGDHVIVELGGEAGGGLPGTVGVGGVWPSLSYPDAATMNADRSQPSGTYVFCRDTGLVHQWDAPGVGLSWFHDPAEFYWRKAAPLAMTARVVRISRTTLTLDAIAAVASNHANVYFDNAPVFNAIARTAARNTALVWRQGKYACGSILEITGRDGVKLAGAGQAATTLFSPRGVISVGIAVNASPRTEVCDLTLAGNAYLASGWGLDFRATTQRSRPQWNYALDLAASDHSHVHDLTFTHPWLAAGAHNSAYCTFRRLSVSTDGMQRYISWLINWVNSTHCASYDCSITSTHLTQGFEIFASNNCAHIRPRGVNVVAALNSTGASLIQDGRFTIQANSQLSDLSFSMAGPAAIIAINTNIPQNAGALSNTVRNCAMTVEGYVNASNDMPIGYNVSGLASGTIISGGSYSAPDWKTPSAYPGPQAVRSQASYPTYVEHLVCSGATKNAYSPNIEVANGSVKDCIAPAIRCEGPHCMIS
jgi:hypothetical protein